MELHPILESDVCPNNGLWYVVSAVGESPSMRVGQTATFVKGTDGKNGQVVVIGGANPDGAFAETFILDLQTFSWDRLDIPGLKARYEHAAFSPECKPGTVYVFGGSDQSVNHNDIQVLDVVNKTWTTIPAAGPAPSPRTYHVTCCLQDKFYVYSGGEKMADPVSDREVYCFDVQEETWSVLNVSGESPKPRLGHVMVPAGDKIILHGGMSASTFYDDLYILNPSIPNWTKIVQKQAKPCARTAHSAFASLTGSVLYIFGGMSSDGALADLHKLNIETKQWSQVNIEGPPPASRLDFAMCQIDLLVPKREATEAPEDDNSVTSERVEKKLVEMCLVMGGMDTQGEIFDDIMAIVIS